MGPRETTFTHVDPAAIGDMGPQGSWVLHSPPVVPNPIATMDEDRVPLRGEPPCRLAASTILTTPRFHNQRQRSS
jgi:hypothetical protein